MHQKASISSLVQGSQITKHPLGHNDRRSDPTDLLVSRPLGFPTTPLPPTSSTYIDLSIDLVGLQSCSASTLRVPWHHALQISPRCRSWQSEPRAVRVHLPGESAVMRHG